MKLAFAVAALLCAARLAAFPQPPAPSAAELARQIQQHYASVRDFTADFTHTYRGALPQTTSDRGTVRIKKPNRMRWTYQAPEKNELVADGVLVWWYVPSDHRVQRSAIPQGDDVSSAVMFLAGRGDLIRDFRSAMPAAQTAGTWQLDLTPTTQQADFETLSLIVDRKTLQWTGLSTVDHDGGTSTFRFTNLKENVGLNDSEFIFRIPPGVDIDVIKHESI
jgi:outer membrane lipoprotein carrier protein